MADQNKLKKRLDALLKLPENQICADCRKRGNITKAYNALTIPLYYVLLNLRTALGICKFRHLHMH